MSGSGRVLLALSLFAVILSYTGCGGGGNGTPGPTPSPATAQGTVRNAQTLQAVSGATVAIGTNQATTGANGAFTIASNTGSRTLTISASGYQTREMNVTLTSGVNSLGVIYLAPAIQQGRGAVQGVVRNSQGATVAGATVRYGNIAATTRDDGTFAIYNIDPGTQSLMAVSGEAIGWASVEVTAGQTTTGVTITIGFGPPPPPSFP